MFCKLLHLLKVEWNVSADEISQSLKSSIFKDSQVRKTCVKLLTCDTSQDDTDIPVADVQYENAVLIDTQLDISSLSRLNVLQLWKF